MNRIRETIRWKPAMMLPRIETGEFQMALRNPDGTLLDGETIAEMLNHRLAYPFPYVSDILGDDWGVDRPADQTPEQFREQVFTLAARIYPDDAGCLASGAAATSTECECWWDGEEIETSGCPLHETDADRVLTPADTRNLIAGLKAISKETRARIAELRAATRTNEIRPRAEVGDFVRLVGEFGLVRVIRRTEVDGHHSYAGVDGSVFGDDDIVDVRLESEVVS